MGGRGGINILGEKKWHVWRMDNRLRAERDENRASDAIRRNRQAENQEIFRNRVEELRGRRRRRGQSNEEGPGEQGPGEEGSDNHSEVEKFNENDGETQQESDCNANTHSSSNILNSNRIIENGKDYAAHQKTVTNSKQESASSSTGHKFPKAQQQQTQYIDPTLKKEIDQMTKRRRKELNLDSNTNVIGEDGKKLELKYLKKLDEDPLESQSDGQQITNVKHFNLFQEEEDAYNKAQEEHKALIARQRKGKSQLQSSEQQNHQQNNNLEDLDDIIDFKKEALPWYMEADRKNQIGVTDKNPVGNINYRAKVILKNPDRYKDTRATVSSSSISMVQSTKSNNNDIDDPHLKSNLSAIKPKKVTNQQELNQIDAKANSESSRSDSDSKSESDSEVSDESDSSDSTSESSELSSELSNSSSEPKSSKFYSKTKLKSKNLKTSNSNTKLKKLNNNKLKPKASTVKKSNNKLNKKKSKKSKKKNVKDKNLKSHSSKKKKKKKDKSKLKKKDEKEHLEQLMRERIEREYTERHRVQGLLTNNRNR